MKLLAGAACILLSPPLAQAQVPAGLHHYDLHVWLFKPNPAGLFSHANPTVKCKDVGYSLVLKPPKSVSHR